MRSPNNVFVESYSRILKKVHNDMTFVEAFYDRFFSIDDRYRKLFENTDFKVQNNMLMMGMFQIYTFSITDMVEYNLKEIGIAHMGLGLNENDFRIWKDCMLETALLYDPKYDSEVKKAWEKVIDASIEIIVQGFEV